MFSEKQIALAPKVNKILTKLGWKWEPKVLEWVIFDLTIWFITDTVTLKDTSAIHILKPNERTGLDVPIERCIPILHWEIIEEILYELGYETGGPWWATKKSGKDRYEFGIFKPVGHWTGVGENRQSSVMDAVLDLGNRPCKK